MLRSGGGGPRRARALGGAGLWVGAALAAPPAQAQATDPANPGDPEQPRDPGAPPPAPAQSPSWIDRYELARELLIKGEYRLAYTEFTALAQAAPNEADRRLAEEMAHVSAQWAARSDASWRSSEPPASSTMTRPRRTTDEISILYTSGFLYGAGTGAWFLLQTQPY